VVFVVAADLPAAALAGNILPLRGGAGRIDPQVGGQAGDLGRIVVLGAECVDPHAAGAADVIAHVGGARVAGLLTDTILPHLVVQGPVAEPAAFLADVVVVAGFGLCAEHKAEVSESATVGDGATGLHLVVQIAVRIDLIGDAGVVHRLQQHHVDHLAAATDVQLAGSATNNFDVVHLCSTDPRQGAAGLIILACHALAIDQDLLATAAPQPATAARALRHVHVAGGRAYSGDAVEHVLRGHRRPFAEIVSWVADGGITTNYLGMGRRGECNEAGCDGCRQHGQTKRADHYCYYPCCINISAYANQKAPPMQSRQEETIVRVSTHY